MNEDRNILLNIMYYLKGKEENKEFYKEQIFDRYEQKLKQEIENYNDKITELKGNLELIDYIKKELGV